jgi:hypothetical protein
MTSFPSDLQAFAAKFPDMETGADAAQHDWIAVPEFPVAILRRTGKLRQFWREETADDFNPWAGLEDYVAAGQVPPGVIALVNDPEAVWPNVWDGNHRLGAAATIGAPTLPMVVGVPKDMPMGRLPPAWKALIGPTLCELRGEAPPAPRKPRAP